MCLLAGKQIYVYIYNMYVSASIDKYIYIDTSETTY